MKGVLNFEEAEPSFDIEPSERCASTSLHFLGESPLL